MGERKKDASVCVKIMLRRRRVFDEFFEGWVLQFGFCLLERITCEVIARSKFFSERRLREKFQLDE